MPARAPEPYEDPRAAGPAAQPAKPKRRRVTQPQLSPNLKVAKGAIRRRPHEVQATRYISSLKLDLISAEILKLHAYQRRVAMTVLISDILNLWIAVATDYNQALFREMLPSGARAAAVPERWAGYLASLGFAPSMLQDSVPTTDLPAAPVDGQTAPEPSHPLPPAAPSLSPQRGPGRPPLDGSNPPPEDERPAAIDLTMPQPMQGSVPPAVAPQVQHVRPPDSEPVAPPSVGWGNAAQMIDLGYHPSLQSPDAPLDARKDR